MYIHTIIIQSLEQLYYYSTLVTHTHTHTHTQQFITPENIEATKMGLDNIAMVWAPNFLRCPSDDHTLIFQNTRKEMAFLRVLLRLIDTNSSATASAL